MNSDTSSLHALAGKLGITPHFRDTLGNAHQASDATVKALIRATGFQSDTDDGISDALAALEADLPPKIPVAHAGTVEMPLAQPADWQIVLEDGTVREGRADDMFRVTGLPIGLQNLTIHTSGKAWTTPLPCPPGRAPSASELTGQARHWGVAAPVYGLPGTCGLGTYADLGELAAGFGSIGAAYTLINPVHALLPGETEAYSPYSPSHRGFFNIAHIDPAKVPEMAASSKAQALLGHAGSPRKSGELVDYAASAAVHDPVLEALFEAFEALAPDHRRRQAFDEWRHARGAPLERYATYQALAEQHGPVWTRWPVELRDVSNLRPSAAHERTLRKHAYFQWLAEMQLADAQAAAEAGGMAFGLMLDLAVGVRADGAETWAEPGNFAQGVSIGAPPDVFNPAGQNWALTPLNPVAMRSGGLRAFASTVRASMRHAGALRIDHILGLRRNFWIADDTGEGAYIRFPQEALFAVLAIEAHRHRCLVVGEDLGNVPAGFRDEMADAGLHGCRLLYFQRTSSGGFVDPTGYEPATVATFGSHDLATLREWWLGVDLDEMEALSVLTGDALITARAQRERDRAELLALIGLDASVDIQTLQAEVHIHLARSGSDLVTLQLEMLVPGGARLNLPGTTTEYPNWRRTFPNVSEILREGEVRRITEEFNRVR